jgi:hypothetical protein
MRNAIIAVAIVLAAISVAAKTRAQYSTGPQTMWFIYPEVDAYDAQTSAAQWALRVGPQNVASVASASHYLVLARINSGSVHIPDDHPYRWAQFGTLAEASGEYNTHGGAAARGIVSTYDGVFVVYWSH